MHLVLFVLMAVAVLSTPSVGTAQSRRESTQKEPAGYRDAIDTALQEMGLGNYEEAREQFARAHALSPNARTLRGLGISEFELPTTSWLSVTWKRPWPHR